MPEDDEVVGEVTVGLPGSNDTPDGDDDMADNVDAGNLAVTMTALASEFGASAARRTQRADQTAADASAMWAISMQTPSQNAALALRTAQEAGSGRTRAETNRPNATAASGSD